MLLEKVFFEAYENCSFTIFLYFNCSLFECITLILHFTYTNKKIRTKIKVKWLKDYCDLLSDNKAE